MRTLITGGAGFLGSHLCERLIARGEEVICLDNFFTGRKRNIEHLRNHPRFETVRHDVVDPFKFEVDRIFNLACPASPVHYQHNPIKTVKTSVMGAINSLGPGKARPRPRSPGFNLRGVRGSEHPPPARGLPRQREPDRPRACYDEGKRCAETLFFDYHRQNGVEIRVVRIFNTYGPRMLPDDGRVVSNFIVQALRGEDITLYGDGQQTRSFCYVDDLIEAMIRMMDQDETVGPVNIGNPGEFTIRELAEMVVELTGSGSKIINHPLPADDPMQRKPIIDQARKHLDWEPEVDLRTGLSRTIDFFRDLLDSTG